MQVYSVKVGQNQQRLYFKNPDIPVIHCISFNKKFDISFGFYTCALLIINIILYCYLHPSKGLAFS